MDKIVKNVIEKYKHRSEIGVAKYGTTLEDNNLFIIEWLNHLQEELMDATLYIEKLKSELYKK
jgi:tRNA A37 threonylcarbamoyladenosine biosynthesis protein TsaE